MNTNRLILYLGVTLLAAGCKREEGIRAYNAPKDPPPPAAAVASADDEIDQEEPGKIEWTAPSSWKQIQAPQMATAAYQVSDDSQPILTISEIVAVGSPRATALMNLHRWEGQLKLPPTPQGDLDKVAHPIKLGKKTARLIDLNNGQQEMLAALIPNGKSAWAFKLVGTAEAVGPHKKAFAELLMSVHFGEAVADSGGKPVDPAPAAEAKIPGVASYTLPQGWKIDANVRPMRAATIIVTDGKQQAEIIVSRLGAASLADPLANLNRWRNSVGLGPTSDVKSHPPQEITLAQGPAVIRDFVGPEAAGAERKRQFVAYTQFPGAEQLWFFRFVGPHDLVSTSKPAFEAFVKSLKFDDK